jgi:tight adherence protein C
MDETDHRFAMIVTVGSALVAVLIGWLLRPQPAARAAAIRGRRQRWSLIAIAGVTGVTVVTSPAVGVATAIGAAVCRRCWRARAAAYAARHISADFPDALDLLVLAIRAGYLPAQAIVEITPFLPQTLRSPFASVGEAMQRGERFGDALAHIEAHLGSIAQPLVDSLAAADRYGLPLAPVLERLAFEARQQRRRDGDATARELPVRLSMPLVLCTLPSFVLLAIVPLLLGALSSLHT